MPDDASIHRVESVDLETQVENDQMTDNAIANGHILIGRAVQERQQLGKAHIQGPAFHAGRLIDPLELAVAQVEAETVPMEERQQLTLRLKETVRAFGREVAFRFDRSQRLARTLER